MKIHPLTLREELLHSFEIKRYDSKWVPIDQTVYYRTKTRRIFRKGKYKTVQAFQKKKKFREVYLESTFKFNRVRVDGDPGLVYSFSRKVKKFGLARILRWNPYESFNPVLHYVNAVRAWAHKQDLSVGGFPLMPYQVVLKSGGKFKNPLADIGEGDEVEGYFALQDAFIKKFGAGQVWKGNSDSDEIMVYVAYFSQSGWREYRSEMPRFFVRGMHLLRTDLGEEGEKQYVDYEVKRGPHRGEIRKRLVGKNLGVSLRDLGVSEISHGGRQMILDYVLNKVADINRQKENQEQINMAPLGIVGWGFGD